MANINPLGLFDDHFQLEKLNKLRDPLLKLDSHIEWDIFSPVLERAFANPDRKKSKGGRPPFNKLMMFKILVLQGVYNLSDDQMEFQIIDRRSFQRFLGLKISDKIPDSKTIWHYRESLIQREVIGQLFDQFNRELDRQGVFANEGRMVDASFVDAPRQRNSREENEKIKQGVVPENWKEKPVKLAQKDTDARWTKKNGVNFYGYKNHVKSDTGTKLIVNFDVTDASVHDSQPLPDLLDESDTGQPMFADSAYVGDPIKKALRKRKMKNKIHQKGYRNKPLTETQKKNNTQKSKTRARVEHIFGFIENSMNGSYVRTIGLARAKAKIGMMNLIYNMSRSIQLKTSVI